MQLIRIGCNHDTFGNLIVPLKKFSSVSARKLKCPSSGSLELEPSQLGLARVEKFQLELISTKLHCGCGNERKKSFLPFPAESTIPPAPINWLVNTFSLWFFPSLTCSHIAQPQPIACKTTICCSGSIFLVWQKIAICKCENVFAIGYGNLFTIQKVFSYEQSKWQRFLTAEAIVFSYLQTESNKKRAEN